MKGSHLDLCHAHVRTLAAFLRYLPGPILFEPESGSELSLTQVTVPTARLFVLVPDPRVVLSVAAVYRTVARSGRDAIIIHIGGALSNKPFVFDIMLGCHDDVDMFADYRLHLAADRTATFVPPDLGDALQMTANGLRRMCELLFTTAVDRLEGVARANVEMTMAANGAECFSQVGRLG